MREDNGADINMQFGCGIYQVNLKNSQKDEPIHSFLMSFEAKMKFDFGDETKIFSPFGLNTGINMAKDNHKIFGRILKFEPKIKEFVIIQDNKVHENST